MPWETFLITLYCVVDTFCQSRGLEKESYGRPCALTVSETLTLALLSQWCRFQSERDFYRFAQQCLRPFFPRLPHRTTWNRSTRRHGETLVALMLHLADLLDADQSPYVAVDRCGIAVRDKRRRGFGWLPEWADIGLCTRLGFFFGFQVMFCCTKDGVITGFGVASASSKDQAMAETFLAARHTPHPDLACVGRATIATYLADKGFSGPKLHRRWRLRYGAHLLCAPQKGHGPAWDKKDRRWLASHRQIIETVHEKLLNTFRLAKERPHDKTGFFARLAAKAALHNACILFNRQRLRPQLAFADLLGW